MHLWYFDGPPDDYIMEQFIIYCTFKEYDKVFDTLKDVLRVGYQVIHKQVLL